MTTKVSRKGQVTIPADIRKQFLIKPGASIKWLVEDDSITLIPLPKDIIAAFRGKGRRQYEHPKFLMDRRTEREKENTEDRQTQLIETDTSQS